MHQHEGHSHSHEVSSQQASSRAFRIGIALNLLYVVAETAAGLYTHSLSLLTDAGHNLSDAASLLLSLIAFYLAKRKPTAGFTYGYRKSTVLAALVNAVILLLAIGMIAYEAVSRFGNPRPLPGGTIAWVAGLGIAVNLGSALLFRRETELNARSAYLHLMADAIVSAGVVLSGVLIYFTHWYIIDTLVSLAVCAVILISTWRLLVDSFRLSLDAVPRHLDAAAIREKILAMDGVERFDHVHIWALSTTENALTAHLSVSPDAGDPFALIARIRHELEHLDIQHATIELAPPRPGTAGCPVDRQP